MTENRDVLLKLLEIYNTIRLHNENLSRGSIAGSDGRLRYSMVNRFQYRDSSTNSRFVVGVVGHPPLHRNLVYV